jgi:hypothetical protein
MDLTSAQRFVYTLTALVFLTILTLVLLNLYALDLFFILLVIEFLIAIELTRPHLLTVTWRKNLPFLVLFCVIIFAIIMYFRLSAIY